MRAETSVRYLRSMARCALSSELLYWCVTHWYCLMRVFSFCRLVLGRSGAEQSLPLGALSPKLHPVCTTTAPFWEALLVLQINALLFLSPSSPAGPMSAFERACLEKMKAELKGSIEKGVQFANK